jgi:hypothetical protein
LIGLRAYFEDDFFEPPLDEVDLRAEDFADDFFAPLFEPEREEVDFFAPDFDALDLDDPDFEALFDELFLLVAGDLAIADILSFPSKGHGNRISRRGEETIMRRLSSNRIEMFGKFIH